MASNADIVRRLFAAFSRRDVATVLELCDPDIVFVPPTGRLAGREEPYRGHDGLRAYLADVGRLWQELRSEPDEYIELDDTVLCTGRVYAWGVGRVIDAPAGWLWRVAVAATVTSTARPMAPPSWRAVLNRPEASPA